MPGAVDVSDAIAPLPVLRNRKPETRGPEGGPEADAAFATLAETRNGGVFAGSFEGESPWERHVNGDELVHVLDDETRVTVLTMTPQPTEHSTADDPTQTDAETG